MTEVLRKFKLASLDNPLIALLCVGFVISALIPPFGVFFSIITAILILSISLFNLTYFLPLLLIILLVSNCFDPYIASVFQPGEWTLRRAPQIQYWQFINPFHMGVLEFINPNWVLGIAATARLGISILYRLIYFSKISWISSMYLLLVAFSVLTSLMGWEMYGWTPDTNERKFQSLMFLFNISICLWFYRLILDLSDFEIQRIINFMKNLAMIALILFAVKFIDYGILVNTHIKFFIFALLPVGFMILLKYGGWYKYFMIILTLLIMLEGFLYQSLTTHILFFSGVFFYVFSIKNFEAKYTFMKLFFFAFVGSQIIIFLTPFMVFDVDVLLSYAVDRYRGHPEFVYLDNDLSIQYVDSFLGKIVYKFSLDRLPLWLGALDAIKDNIWLMPSGSSYIPYKFGTFSAPLRQIQWVAGAHQMQLELMTNYGLLGAVLYWGIWVTFMRKIFDAVHSSYIVTRFLSVGLLSYFIFPSYIANFMLQEHSAIPWLLLGFTMALYSKYK